MRAIDAEAPQVVHLAARRGPAHLRPLTEHDRVGRAAKERRGHDTGAPGDKSVGRVAARRVVAGGAIRKRHRHVPKLTAAAVRRIQEQLHDLVGRPAGLAVRLALVRVREHDRGVGLVVVRRPLRPENQRRGLDVRHEVGEDRWQAAARGRPVTLVREGRQPAGKLSDVVVRRQPELFQVVLT